jgi:uncharacterized membrane protein YadS
MSEEKQTPRQNDQTDADRTESRFSELWKKEDWWAVWLGLGLIFLTLIFFWTGSSIKSWAVTPGSWSDLSGIIDDLTGNYIAWIVLFIGFLFLFTLSTYIMGIEVKKYIPGFIVLFVGSLLIFYISASGFMKRLDIGAPLLALIIGLIISNLKKPPSWLQPALLTEFYIKTGIVLLGATLPLTLIFTAGPIAFFQATIVSLCTWLTIYFVATKIFKLDNRFGAVLGAGGAVCGVSASIAVGGAVKAKKDHIAIGIAVVSIWAIVMIFLLTFITKAWIPEQMSPGVAGAWIGTSEFADAAGFAVAAELANDYGDAPIHTFTLMKVIGRDIWIGIWAFVLSIISVLFWEKKQSTEGRLSTGVIWGRFPKFVLGFFAASIIMSLIAAGEPDNYAGEAGLQGTFKTKAQKSHYNADFSNYKIPDKLISIFSIDQKKSVIRFEGKMSLNDLELLLKNAASEDQKWALKQLHLKSDWYEGVLIPTVISPIKKLRSWCFVICFLCIGLSTRFKDLATFGLKPFWAFTIGVFVNVPLGFFLSTYVFVEYWNAIM